MSKDALSGTGNILGIAEIKSVSKLQAFMKPKITVFPASLTEIIDFQQPEMRLAHRQSMVFLGFWRFHVNNGMRTYLKLITLRVEK